MTPQFNIVNSFGLKVIVAYFSFLALLSMLLELNTSRYDWDLDHELYFGQRLAQGELIWLTEYNDKLFLQQLLFAPAGVLGEINLWRVMSLGILLLLILVLNRFGAELVGKVFLTSRERAAFTWLVALFMTFFIFSFPGGLSHINFFSAGAGMLTIMFLSLIVGRNQVVSFWYLSIAAAFFGTLSISVRPYFFLPIAVVWLFIFLSEVIRPIAGADVNRFRMLWPIAMMGVLGFSFNVLPYLVMGQIDAFREGLMILASRRNPVMAWHSFLLDWTSQPNLFVVGGLLLAGIFIVSAASSRNFFDAHRFFVQVAIAAVALFAAIFMRHWWAHYAMMFVPFIAVLFAITTVLFFRGLLLFLRRRGMNHNRQLERVAVSVLAAFALLLTQGVVERAQTSDMPPDTYLETMVIGQWLSDNGESGSSFLAPYNIKAHWMLREGRHGFPHAANFMQIDLGWWSQAPSTVNFTIFRDTSEACTEVYRSSVDVIFLPALSPLGLCFERSFDHQDRSRVPHQLEFGIIAWKS